jgi:hypothetical protein
MEANRKLRFGVMTLLYYSEGTIVEMIDNCAPFVDKIYVGFSDLPWSDYNKNARTEFKGSASLDVLKDSKWHDKIEVISGVWKSEVDERNDILSKARQDGMDYLIIQDADEFYHPEDYCQSKSPRIPLSVDCILEEHRKCDPDKAGHVQQANNGDHLSQFRSEL